jgi:outer membrane protein OmpA-like peptidoglycan-associated protein
MEDTSKIISGIFEGDFYTHQKGILSVNEINKPTSGHHVHIISGKISNLEFEEEYSPENIRKLGSLFLHNVTNIEAVVINENRKIENLLIEFEQLIIQDAKVINSWELNGKTYGLLKGLVIGKTSKISRALEIKNERKNDNSDLVILSSQDDTIHNISGSQKEDITSDINKDGTNNELDSNKNDEASQNNWDTNVFSGIKDQSKNDIIKDTIVDKKKGSADIISTTDTSSGCTFMILIILMSLAILLLLVCCFKGCANGKEEIDKLKNEKYSIVRDSELLQKKIDSLNLFSETLKDRIKKMDLQNKINKLSSKVYFKGNSVDIISYSMYQIRKIVELLNTHTELMVEVRGFYNGYGAETLDPNCNCTYDLARANRVKELLIQNGIDKNRLRSIGMGQSTDYPDKRHETVIDNERFVWNENMRVEIVIIND